MINAASHAPSDTPAEAKATAPWAAPELSLVIPCYNECDTIEAVVQEWSAFLAATLGSYEMIIVNDGSSDGTGRIVDRLRKEHRCLRVFHQLNLGHDAAVRRGYEAARGRFIAQVDGTGRHEPADFARLWEERRDARLILGSRAHRLDGIVHGLLSRALRRLAKVLFGVSLRDPNAPLRVMQRFPAVTYLKRIPAAIGAIDLALTLLTAQEFPEGVREVPVPHRPRRAPFRREGLAELAVRASHFTIDLFRLRYGKATRPDSLAFPAAIPSRRIADA